MTMGDVLPGQEGRTSRRVQAAAIGLGLAAASMLAMASRLAETPAAEAAPGLAALGPGKLGVLRAIQPDKQGLPPVGIAKAGRAALPGSPIAFEPFFGAAAEGFSEPGTTGTKKDAALLREAIRRNPRSREARLLLVRHALGAGDLGEAIDQLAVLNRLGNPAAAQMMTSLGRAVATEAHVDEVTEALASYPELYRPFLLGFTTSDKPMPLVIRLTSRVPEPVLADQQTRQWLLNQLVRTGAFASAQALWTKTSGVKETGLVHSPDFSDTKSSPPFNWDLTQNQVGAAERAPDGGITVAYYGRSHGVLARQLLTLSPGDYQASLTYRGDGGTPGGIALRVRCVNGNLVIGEAVLDAVTGRNAVARINFTVPPAGCEGQYLALEGRALERRSSHYILAQKLTVARGGAK